MPFASDDLSARPPWRPTRGPALTMRFSPRRRRSIRGGARPLETSTMVALVIVSVCAERRGVAAEKGKAGVQQ